MVGLLSLPHEDGRSASIPARVIMTGQGFVMESSPDADQPETVRCKTGGLAA
jgi:hypothetical protein